MQLVRAVDDTFCILVLGDFLGAASGFPDSPEVHWLVRRATPDTVMELTGLRPRIRVSRQTLTGTEGEGAREEDRFQEGGVEELELATLHDFDPLALYRRSNLFHPFREARDAARKEGSEAGQPAAEGDPRPPLPADGGSPDRRGLLDAVLDATEPAPPPTGPIPGTKEDLEAFVKAAVRPHLVPNDTDEKARVAAVDEAAGRCLSNLLHTRGFQDLESLWRSLAFLLSRADTTGKVRVYLAHVPQPVLEAELESSEDLARSRLYELLSSPPPGPPGRRWAVAVGAYGFGPRIRDVDLLTDIARIARAAEVPWFSDVRFRELPFLEHPPDEPTPGAGSLEGFSFEPLPDEWQRLRETPEATWVGLTCPRFLVREPHRGSEKGGKEPELRETVGAWQDFLWGPGAFLVASLLADGYAREGWGFAPERSLDLGGMPMGAPEGESGSEARSVETSLSPRSAQRLMDVGVIPVLGFPQRAGIRIGGIHPLAAPRTTIRGWWT